MKIINTEFDGVYIIENFSASDDRGCFVKSYNEDFFLRNTLDTDFKETFYSTSKKNVIRGMHFQLPPCDHTNLVNLIKGEIVDVILDLRKNSNTFGKVIYIPLNEYDNKSIYISKGFAHGFKSLKDDTIVNYSVSTVYNKDLDFGINYKSIDFDWNISTPIISNRDLSFIDFEDFKNVNPF